MDGSAVILAGGRGQRMGGRNKALLTFGREAFIDRQIRICSGWTHDVVVVTNDDTFRRQLQARHNITVVSDSYAGQGPLAGLHAGLKAAACPAAWVLACDQPLPHPGAASLLRDRLIRHGSMAAVPVVGGRPQPLHAVYRREAAVEAEALIQSGNRRLLALLENMTWIGVPEDEFVRHGIPATFAKDVDTPDDYDRLRDILT